MKICVTGGAGMIGSTLVRKLIDLGNEVTVIDNLWRGKIDNLKGIEGFDIETDFHKVDISTSKNIKNISRILKKNDVVIHLADLVAGIGFVFDNQYEIFRVNNAINTNLFSACESAEVPKILYAGTACSFPKMLQRSLTSVLKEEQLFPAYPESAYGWSKLMGTLELGFLSEKYRSAVCTLILHNVYGPYCDIDLSRSQVIPSLIRKMIELPSGGTLKVWGSGNQGRAFIYVDDIATAFIKAIEKNNLPSIIQIGPSICTSIKQLVNYLQDIIKKDLNLFYDISKPEGDIGRSADSTIAKNVLEWESKVPLSVGLQNTYQWIKSELNRNK